VSLLDLRSEHRSGYIASHLYMIVRVPARYDLDDALIEVDVDAFNRCNCLEAALDHIRPCRGEVVDQIDMPLGLFHGGIIQTTHCGVKAAVPKRAFGRPTLRPGSAYYLDDGVAALYPEVTGGL